MKYKIVDSGFNEETGISYVTIQNSKGIYTGYSKLQEEDKKYVSQNAGCRYAEIKANIKMLNDEIKEVKNQLHAFEIFYINISKSKKFNCQSYEARKIRKNIYVLKNKIIELTNLKFSIRKTLMTVINNRQKEIDNFYKKIEQIKASQN